MFKEMRRQDRKMNEEKAHSLLVIGQYGILSINGGENYAYGIPLNYVYADKKIYFHCAVEGHKLENIKKNNKVSFCVVGKGETIPHKFSTRYESVIAFGIVEEITDEEKKSILLKFVEKYAIDYMDEGKKYIASSEKRTKVLKMSIDHITGKERI